MEKTILQNGTRVISFAPEFPFSLIATRFN